ncbi:type II-A CRISPR-associated protein Csn2 [Ligilactobacillus salivarius]|uniref:type II-A CRISPR-associated protein Csn2 n=1 Tax=Ligilactobacillus salivarius TaxID=1624 RepID=UPI00339C9129
MKLYYTGHKNIDINTGEITVLGTNNVNVYKEFIDTFLNGYGSNIQLSDDKYNRKDISTSIDWDGDVMLTDRIGKKYMNVLIKKIIENLTDDERQAILKSVNGLYDRIREVLYKIDIPLQVDYDNDLTRLFKYCQVHTEALLWKNAYDRISSDVKLHVELNRERIIGLTNVAHYLTKEEFQELVNLVKATNTSMFIIEFTEKSDQRFFENCDNYYIDEDYIDWY